VPEPVLPTATIIGWHTGRGNAARRCGNWPSCATGLEAAEDALTDALAAMKRAETAYDAANDRFAEAEQALDTAREQRAQARQARTQPGRLTNGRVVRWSGCSAA
jgi:exonuclease VII small subunit